MARPVAADAKDETEEVLLREEVLSTPGDTAASRAGRWAVLLAAFSSGVAATLLLADRLGAGDLAAAAGSPASAVQLVAKSTRDDTTCAVGQENCHESQCCDAPGMQCYEQDTKYAQCRSACEQGPDPTHWDGKKWSCAELGSRTEGEDRCAEDWKECAEAKCCKGIGFQCFKKNASHAVCKSECVAGGPDLSDADAKPWSCEEAGPRKPGEQPWVEGQCSAGLDNCVETACCKVPGQQCFLQNDYYGNCMTACVGVGDGDPWSCKPRGSITPFPPVKASRMSPWALQNCSLPNQGCAQSKCCLGANMQCYEKNKDWASCQKECTPGKNSFDNDEEWNCKELGPRSYGLAIKGFPSLYCFALMRPDSYEFGLMKAQLAKGSGIFACDDSAVLTADTEATIEGPNGNVKTIQFQGAPVVTSQDGTAGNTELFVSAWYAVVKAQTWKNHSWIVKADPDAVVIPERLRWHLAPHTGEHVFILNCNKYPGPNYPMVYGAVEVFSNSAIQVWAENGHDCYAPNTYGEDYYITRCMDHLGVGRVLDEKVLGDNLCMGANCADGWIAAFHPYKDIDSWEQCYNTAMGTPH